MTSLIKNVERLLNFRGKGPRRLAQAEALRPPAPTPSSVLGYPEKAGYATVGKVDLPGNHDLSAQPLSHGGFRGGHKARREIPLWPSSSVQAAFLSAG